MKNIFTLAGYLMIFISCTKDIPTVVSNSDIIPRNNTAKGAKEVLVFKNMEELNQTVTMLLNKDIQQRKEWYDSIGFVSQRALYSQAIAELECIQELTDFQRYQKEIKKYQNKYSKHFLFNENKEENDMSPYIPSNESVYSLVCNVNGDVVVDNKIKNFNKLKSFEETNFYKQSHATTTRTVEEKENFLYVQDGKRKMWAEAVRHERGVYIEYSAHKKGVFGGWNKYQTQYNIRFISEGFGTWTEKTNHFLEVIRIAPAIFTTRELPSGEQILYGNTNYNISTGQVITHGVAEFEINSRGSGEQKGILRIRK